MGLSRLVLLFVLALFGAIAASNGANALENTVYNQQTALSKQTYNDYLTELQTLKASLQLKAVEIGKIADCQKQGRLYTSSGCANVFSPEVDPTKKAHTAVEPTNCAGGYVQVWSGSTWGCKEIRNQVVTTSPPNQKTWQMASGENCGDVFGRPCVAADNTCPGASNPFGKNCTGGLCNYVSSSKNFIMFVCQ